MRSRFAIGVCVVALVLASCGADSIEAGSGVGLAESEARDSEAVAAPTTPPAGTASDGSADNAVSDSAESDSAESESDREQAITSTTAAPSPYLIDTRGGGTNGAETSQRATDTNELPVVMYEHIALDEGGTVAGLIWEGIYCRLIEDAPEPEPHASGFTITFFSDDGGSPGESLWVEEFEIGEVAETFETSRVQTCGTDVETTWSFYSYEIEFRSLFDLRPGTEYWMSVQAITPSFNTYWGWQNSSVNPTRSIQEFNGANNAVSSGRSFALLAPA